MTKLFSLNKGDSFTLDDKEYTVDYCIYKIMPKLGKTLNCVCFDNEGEEHWFTKNWDVVRR